MSYSNNGFQAVFNRELKAIFLFCPFYITASVFVFSISIIFFVLGGFFLRGEADVTSLFSTIRLLLGILIPLLTMKIWSDEKSNHTDLLLLTLPISEMSIIIGKFCAESVQVFAILLVTVLIPCMLVPFGIREIGLVFSCYFGLYLYALMLVAAGTFFSCLCSNQLLTLIVLILFNGLFSVLDALSRVLSIPLWFSSFCSFCSFSIRFSGFFRGIIDTRDILFFVFLTFIFIRATIFLLCYRRGR